jgi:hypothetical protein
VSEIGQAARKLLAGRPGDGNSAEQIAQRACEACERLGAHLSRLLGEAGVQMLLQRSVSIASAQFPWLQTASGGQPGPPCSALRHAMEQQEPGSSTDAFAEVFSAFVGLLKRLIGDGLVDRLLNEVWPAVFVPAVKDIP